MGTIEAVEITKYDQASIAYQIPKPFNWKRIYMDVWAGWFYNHPEHAGLIICPP